MGVTNLVFLRDMLSVAGAGARDERVAGKDGGGGRGLYLHAMLRS